MDAACLARLAAGSPEPPDLAFDETVLDGPDGGRSVLDAVAAGAATGSADCLDALLSLIDAHHLDRRAIRRLIIDDTDADDVHQDVLIAVARSITTFRGDAAFTTWLHTVARNTAVAHLRRQKVTDPLADDDGPATDAQRLSSMIALRGSLVAALEALPAHYRSVVVLRDIDQRTYHEIAAELDLPLNTVRSRLSRGRALVARAVLDEDTTGGAVPGLEDPHG